MDDTEKIAAVEKYVRAFAENDLGLIKEIYAEDATVEDPVGSEAHRGIAAITDFYRQGMAAGARLELTGPPRCAGDAVAFPFCCTASGMRIQVIDVFEFDNAGKVVSMRAYWGSENVTAS